MLAAETAGQVMLTRRRVTTATPAKTLDFKPLATGALKAARLRYPQEARSVWVPKQAIATRCKLSRVAAIRTAPHMRVVRVAASTALWGPARERYVDIQLHSFIRFAIWQFREKIYGICAL